MPGGWRFCTLLLLVSCSCLGFWVSRYPLQELEERYYSSSSTTSRVRFDDNTSSSSRESKKLSLTGIAFGIAGTVEHFSRRKEFVKLWWRPGLTRGTIWYEEQPVLANGHDLNWELFPTVRVYPEPYSTRYRNPSEHPTSARLFHILVELVKELPDAKWFVLCHDDTIFSVDNLVTVLSLYDAEQVYYIGSLSESHKRNTRFSFQMATGGAGIAFSRPLARALVHSRDQCLKLYGPHLQDDDEQLHVCLAELGVPLTKEPGFHQFDLSRTVRGLLSVHPVAPFVSIHHVDFVDPPFPKLDSVASVKLLYRAMEAEPTGFLQQSMCYDWDRGLSISVSTGYVAQVFPEIVYPHILQKAEVHNSIAQRDLEADSKQRPLWLCKQPVRFYLNSTDVKGDMVDSYYKQEALGKFKQLCWSIFNLPKTIRVTSTSVNWHKTRRRQCCRMGVQIDRVLSFSLGPCVPHEAIIP